MKKLMLKYLIVALFFQIPAILIAQKATGAASYLRIGMGSRAIAMGKAYTSLADDASATYWNPAGLIKVKKFDFMITNRIDENIGLGSDFFSVAVVYSLSERFGAVGLSFFNYGVNDIYQFDDKAQYLGSFDYSAKAMFFSYCIGNDLFSIGANVKYLLHQFQLGDYPEDNGVGFDIGFMYQVLRKWQVGLILRDNVNIGLYDQMDGSVQAGTHYQFDTSLFNSSQTTIVAMDVEQVQTKPFRIHFGIETEFRHFSSMAFQLRYGLGNFYLESRTNKIESSILRENSRKHSFGIGVVLSDVLSSKLIFDYTFVIESLTNASFFSFRYGL